MELTAGVCEIRPYVTFYGKTVYGEVKNIFFLVKMPLWYILSIPKCKNIFRNAIKLHLM
jgi:hypothetical protein